MVYMMGGVYLRPQLDMHRQKVTGSASILSMYRYFTFWALTWFQRGRWMCTSMNIKWVINTCYNCICIISAILYSWWVIRSDVDIRLLYIIIVGSVGNHWTPVFYGNAGLTTFLHYHQVILSQNDLLVKCPGNLLYHDTETLNKWGECFVEYENNVSHMQYYDIRCHQISTQVTIYEK